MLGFVYKTTSPCDFR